MAVTALVLYVIFGALGFGWRSLRQYRTTGSTGFRGVSGRPGSLEWLAGVGFVAAILVGLAGVALQLTGIVAPLEFLTATMIQLIGVVLAVAGIGATLVAQNQMGASWRIGVDASETTALVHTGVFALVRNPIFTAMLVFAAGIALIVPNIVALAAFALLLGTIEGQVRVVEEPYPARVHGVGYREYCARTPRFVPGIGR
ncbi:isoprenylcysteine carboxyl methyltransferase [Nocardia sp. MH4]|uniref:methyltransferase family protein n=1 Tax=Nocardia sp. MH4 TaxID=1768677 RepID=UPI001C4E8C58|nr:isoprenylcysteine carboxylmethyltransferase family protein [Nocardia sp. MH4]MBW0272694.1 isoprenylcysteine carboxyl methyltransferase [Nocardia sp. MH4]